jgi:hypothetical protein
MKKSSQEIESAFFDSFYHALLTLGTEFALVRAF